MINLINRLEIFVTAINKFFKAFNQSIIFFTLSKYWKQAFYNCFHNLNKLLGCNKQFLFLWIVLRYYKNT